MTYKEIYKEFCEWSPEHADMVVDYKPWGTNSIIVWLRDGYAYKCKRYGYCRFVMQIISYEDIRKKYGLNK